MKGTRHQKQKTSHTIVQPCFRRWKHTGTNNQADSDASCKSLVTETILMINMHIPENYKIFTSHSHG